MMDNLNESDESDFGTQTTEDSDTGQTKLTVRKLRSGVWSHFEIIYEELEDGRVKFAKCIFCDKKYNLTKSGSSTSNLSRHTKTHHSDKSTSKDNSECGNKFEFSYDAYRSAVLKWVVLSNQPFTEPQQPSFVEVVKSLNPKAEALSNKVMRSDLMSNYEEQLFLLKAKIEEIPGKVSFTQDAWTSKNQLPFMAIRAHWISNDWKQETVLLDFQLIEGKHSGKNLSKMFLNCLDRFGIPLSKIMAVTMDNASNNDTFMEHLSRSCNKLGAKLSSVNGRVRCLAHVLNLGVQDMLNSLKVAEAGEEIGLGYCDEEGDLEVQNVQECGENEDERDDDELQVQQPSNQSENGGNHVVETSTNLLICKIRKLVIKIRLSTQLRQDLKRHCQLYKIIPLEPVIDVKTRWNSTYLMIKRAEELKVPLNTLVASVKSLSPLRIHEEEWDELKPLKDLLSKFDRATRFMSKENHPTITSYLPTFNWLVRSLEMFEEENVESLADAAKAALEKLEKYNPTIETTEIPFVATFFNPALKLSYLKEQNVDHRLIKKIKTAIEKIYTENYEHNISEACPSNSSNDDYDDELFAFMNRRAKKPKLISEFQTYLNAPLSDPKIDVLMFWKTHEHVFPNLSCMARDYLSVQSSSVSVERDFSAGVDVVTPNRCSLKPEAIRAIMCLKNWWKN